MHAATLASSPRLQRVLDFLLAAGGPRSTLDIAMGARVCAVNSCVAELREGGIRIDCRQTAASGERVWLYSLDLSDERTARLVEEYRQPSLFGEDAA